MFYGVAKRQRASADTPLAPKEDCVGTLNIHNQRYESYHWVWKSS